MSSIRSCIGSQLGIALFLIVSVRIRTGSSTIGQAVSVPQESIYWLILWNHRLLRVRYLVSGVHSFNGWQASIEARDR
jgi:hypothetical protein